MEKAGKILLIIVSVILLIVSTIFVTLFIVNRGEINRLTNETKTLSTKLKKAEDKISELENSYYYDPYYYDWQEENVIDEEDNGLDLQNVETVENLDEYVNDIMNTNTEVSPGLTVY